MVSRCSGLSIWGSGVAMALATLFLTGTPALATEKSVVVDGRCRPWDVRANPQRFFGSDEGHAPTVVFDINLHTGETLKLTAVGATTTIPGGGPIGPEGEDDWVANDRAGNSGAFFPSRYVDPKTYPARLNELMGAFVDADGAIVDKPFLIGRGTQVKVPAGAVALSMGINDDIYGDNSGQLTVTISYRVAIVTGQEVQ